MSAGGRVCFVERRRLPRPLDVAVVVFAVACVASLPVLLVVADTGNLASKLGLVGCLGLVPVLIAACHSRVVVADGRVTLALVPLWRKRLSLDELAEVRQRAVSARELGGLGVRRTGDGATALVLRGSAAVEVVTRDGRRYVVGTGRPGELARVLAGGTGQDGAGRPSRPHRRKQ